jgi:hypothetical protein
MCLLIYKDIAQNGYANLHLLDPPLLSSYMRIVSAQDSFMYPIILEIL